MDHPRWCHDVAQCPKIEDPMISVILGGTDSYERGRGSRGCGNGLRGIRYYRVPHVLEFYIIPTRSGGEPKQC